MYEVCSCIHLKCLRILYWVLGVSHDILDGKRHVFLFPPRILHGFVHPGKILRHLRWMQEQTSSVDSTGGKCCESIRRLYHSTLSAAFRTGIITWRERGLDGSGPPALFQIPYKTTGSNPYEYNKCLKAYY
jgi:hypothetical protein